MKATDKLVGKKILLECDQHKYKEFTIKQVVKPYTKILALLVDRIDESRVEDNGDKFVDMRLVYVWDDEFYFANSSTRNIAGQISALYEEIDDLEERLTETWLEDIKSIKGN